jgi:hypothetical protein
MSPHQTKSPHITEKNRYSALSYPNENNDDLMSECSDIGLQANSSNEIQKSV